MLNAKIPAGKLDDKWVDYKGHCKLVNPANKRKMEVIVVGTGLAGASAAASLGEMGYKVKHFVFRIVHVVHTQLLHKVVLTQQRITKTMVIVYLDYSMTLLKGVTIEHVRPMCIV